MLQGKSVLIAEDSLTQAVHLQSLLEGHQCEVRVVGDGVEALELVARARPDIVISDVVMPNMDGYELCRRLKSQPETAGIPLILVTTLTDPRDVVRGLACGADNFITKPYDETYLLSRMRYLLVNYEHRAHERVQIGIEVELDGERHFITAARQQILDLLISIYEEGIRLNRELKAKHAALSESNALVNSLFQFTAELSAANSEWEIIHRGLERIATFSEVAGTWLLLGSGAEEGAEWRLAGAAGEGFDIAKLQQRCDNCPCLHARAADHIHEVVDIDRCPALAEQAQQHHATIPLFFGSEVIGLLNVVRSNGLRWDSEQLLALRAIGHQYSVALGRARLFEDLELMIDQRTAELQDEMARREHAQAELRLRNQALESSVNAVMIFDVVSAENPIVYVNPAFERITGYRRQEVLGQDYFRILTGGREQQGLDSIRHALRNGTEGQALLQHYRNDGSLFWNDLRVAPVRDGSGRIRHFVGVLNDVTETKLYQEQLEHQANFDGLTGLPNRNLLMDRIQQAIAHMARHRSGFVLAFIDLDNFKYVNDSLGHLLGDQLLCQVGDALRPCMREGDTLARLGGDEFVVLLNEVDTPDTIDIALRRILDAVALPKRLDSTELLLTCSIGYCIYPQDGDDATTLLKNADNAMYRAKELGRSQICSYEREMDGRVRKRLKLEYDLRMGLERSELELYYQPQWSYRERRMVGAEALVRWRRDDQMVSPGEFIPVAEETGLILDLDAWVLRSACLQTRNWLDAGLPPLTVSVNLSARQFKGAQCVPLIKRVLEETGLPPEQLKIEVTESMVIQNADDALDTMKRLRDMGVALAMDDFGTGYSSLSYLKRFPFQQLKIDKSFVDNLVEDREGAAIVHAVLELSRTLGIQTVAEGVETQGQYDYLLDAGCDLVQGYFYSRPLAVADCADFLSRQGRGDQPFSPGTR